MLTTELRVASVSPKTEETWHRRTEWPLNGLAVAFLAAYAWPILQPDLAHEWVRMCDYVAWGTWAAFGVDYFVRLVLSNIKWIFVRTHLLDFIVLLLPALRPLRAVRALMALRQLHRWTSRSLRGRTMTYIITATLLVIFVAALAVLDAERGHPQANIVTFPDALWWATATVLTVGYGDRVPITMEGRFVGVGLMIAGISLVGVVTAALASWFIERIGSVQEAEEETQNELAALTQELRELPHEVQQLRSG